MPNEVSVLKISGTPYNIKDAEARQRLDNIEATVGIDNNKSLYNDGDNDSGNDNVIDRINSLRSQIQTIDTELTKQKNVNESGSLAKQIHDLGDALTTLSTQLGGANGEQNLTARVTTIENSIGDVNTSDTILFQINQLNQTLENVFQDIPIETNSISAASLAAALDTISAALTSQQNQMGNSTGVALETQTATLSEALELLLQQLGDLTSYSTQNTVVGKLEQLISQFQILYNNVGVAIDSQHSPSMNGRLTVLENKVGSGIVNSNLTNTITQLEAALTEQTNLNNLLKQSLLLKNINDTLGWEEGTISASDGTDVASEEYDVVLFSVEDPYVSHIDYLRTAAFPINSWFKITPLNNYEYQIFLYSGDISDLQFETIYYFSAAPYDIASSEEIYNPFLTSNYTYCRLVTYSAGSDATPVVENIDDYIKVFAPMTPADILGS